MDGGSGRGGGIRATRENLQGQAEHICEELLNQAAAEEAKREEKIRGWDEVAGRNSTSNSPQKSDLLNVLHKSSHDVHVNWKASNKLKT
ncbi:hypothetical protein Q5P01_015618 [Channa striata]|uniref:Uncharacterized protein n=1 Tax=Channa striata TaxID=64152 RepID=A0AA88SD91_CHASR|nr:hypothetical protein Q5P01_015618 [Channa striata]